MVSNRRNSAGDRATTHTVVELSSALTAFAGRILAEGGVRVVRVAKADEPPAALEALHFHAGKETAPAGASLGELLAGADGVLVDSTVDDLDAIETALESNPELVVVDVPTYGSGPWQGRPGSDLTLLAAGGVLGSCGYDSGPHAGMPVAPTGGQAVNMVGMLAAMAMLAAIVDREGPAPRRWIEVAAQHAIAVSTEMAVPYWSYQGAQVKRHTGRHAMPYDSPIWQHRCSDGRYFSALPLYIDDRRFAALKEWMESKGFEHRLLDTKYDRIAERSTMMHDVVGEIGRFAATLPAQEMFESAQERGLPWAPVLTAAECAQDDHFRDDRRSFADVALGELTGKRARMPFTFGED